MNYDFPKLKMILHLFLFLILIESFICIQLYALKTTTRLNLKYL